MKLQQEFDTSMISGYVSVDKLIDAIEAAAVTIQIKVPSQDYYARAGEAQTESLTYVCPRRLLEALNLLK